MKKKAYISGPMTGYPDLNRPAFLEAERLLQEAGCEVINPMRNGLDDTATWQQHMRRDITMLMEADCVALLDGWQGSRGAMAEFNIASDLEFPIKTLNGWLRIGG